MIKKKKIAVGVSGSGTTFEAITKAIEAGELSLDLSFMFCDRDCPAEKRAEKHQIRVVKRKEGESVDDFQQRVLAEAKKEGIDLIVLAGYLRLFPVNAQDPYLIINSHPGAIPYFGGPGFWGIRVHRAVLAFAQKTNFRHPFTYSTVHIASSEYDKGPVVGIKQMKIEKGDTAERIAERLLPLEHQNYIEVLKDFSENNLSEKKYPADILLEQEGSILKRIRAD